MDEQQPVVELPQVRPPKGSDLRRVAAIEDSGVALYAAHLGEEAVTDALRSPAPSGAQRAAAPGFVLVIGKPAVGFVHVIHLDGHAHLEQVSVLPEAQRHGYGTALVRAAMREAERDGFRSLSLCTYAELPWNGPFYAGLGFTEVERLLPFQRRLREHEQDLGLDETGRRVVMAVDLEPEQPRPEGIVEEPEPVDPFAVEPAPDEPVPDQTAPDQTAPGEPGRPG